MKFWFWLSFLLINIIINCGMVSGQSSYYIEEPKVFTGGLILGANFTQIDGDTYFGYHKVGLHAGGVVYVHFTNVIGASMELLYTEKGSRGESILKSPTVGPYVAKYYMDVNYVEVPVTFHVITHKLDVEAGASYARLVHAHEWILSEPPVAVDPVKNRFSTSDVDFILGLGGKIYKNLHLSMRFQYSLTSIRPPDRIPYGFVYGNIGQFNNLFSLRAMYMF